MNRGQQPRIAIVTRETRLKSLLQRWATRGQARYSFQRARAAAAVQANDMAGAVAAQTSNEDADFQDMEVEDAAYADAIRQLSQDLDLGIPVQVVDRQYMPNYDFSM